MGSGRRRVALSRQLSAHRLHAPDIFLESNPLDSPQPNFLAQSLVDLDLTIRSFQHTEATCLKYVTATKQPLALSLPRCVHLANLT